MNKKDTRMRIISTAFELFSKKGYASTTTRELAKKAGVNEVTIFRIFKSKENLYREMLGHYADVEYVTGQVRFDVTGDVEKDLKKALKDIFRPIPSRDKIIKLIMKDAHANPIVKKRLAEFPMGLSTFFSDHLRALIPKGSTRDVDLDIASMILLSYMMRYSMMNSMIGKDPLNANSKENIEKFLDIFLYGILKPDDRKGGV